jgi:hypothetical protein
MIHDKTCDRVTNRLHGKLGPRMWDTISENALHPYREGRSYLPVSHINNLLTLEIDEITKEHKT